MSTLISDLDERPDSNDGDFVNSIIKTMNGGGGDGGVGDDGGGMQPPIQPPPAIGGMQQGGVIQAPNPNTMGPRIHDSGPITAHMIGNSHPTPADFAQMIGSVSGPAGTPAPAPTPQGQWAGHMGAGAPYMPAPTPSYIPAPAKKSWLTRTAEELRTATFVAILVFLFSLPVVNFLFAHYMPSMVKSTGELTLVGLLMKSFAAGGAFWLLQRVVVPLLSL